MKALKNKKGLLTLGVTFLVLSACSNGEAVKYERGKDEDIYNAILGDYKTLYEAAQKETDDSERYVKYAKAEAALLDSAIMVPTTTQNGAYAITRVAPRTVPYVLYGIDGDKLKGVVAITGENTFIKSTERAEMLELWKTAKGGGAAYDPATYLKGKGYTLANTYKTTFQTAPATLDFLNTSEQADTEILTNCVEGLVEYDNLGNLRGLLAVEGEDGKPYTLSEDGLTYTFTIRDDAKWYTADNQIYASVTAEDFVSGFHHMLDADSGLDYLVSGVVEGVEEYLGGESFDKVGVSASGNKFSIKLVKPENFFVTRLVYSCFMPMNKAFYESKGGAFGAEAIKAAKAAGTYKYGDTADTASILYNGPYTITKFAGDSEIKLAKTDKYWGKDKVTINEISWIFDNGENPEQTWKDVKSGVYAGQALSAATGSIQWAKDDGLFDEYHYITETNATSYFSGHNVNRGTFKLKSGAVASTQTEAQKVFTHWAMNNKNFRKALAHGFNRKAWNAVSRGADLAETNLRNIYTAPSFVAISKDVTVGGHTFPQGTEYGDLVQYFVDELGCVVNCADGQDGWYNKTVAQHYYGMFCIDAIKAGYNTIDICVDVAYYSGSTVQVAQAQAFKLGLEESLPGVHVNLVEATTANDYYACGYRANTGTDLNQDIFYGSGWGPDFADPSSYLETFLPEGYMTKVCGINAF